MHDLHFSARHHIGAALQCLEAPAGGNCACVVTVFGLVAVAILRICGLSRPTALPYLASSFIL
eukprot:6061204-Alexandrium_andersonii.AAC.1